jgi:hypothetical protein
MKPARTAAALVSAALLSTGCALTPGYVPLAKESRSSLGELSVRSIVVQDEIVLTAPQSGLVQAAGGGLLAALIESDIAKGRQDALQKVVDPFYNQIDDYDFRKELWQALVPFLRQGYPLRVASVTTTSIMVPKLFSERWAANIPAGKSVMILRTRYTFTDQFRRLEIVTELDLWQRGKPQPTFANAYQYLSAPVGGGDHDSIAKWSEKGGALYRKATREGIQETLRMLRLDAAGAGGEVRDTRAVRRIVRDKDGRLVSAVR